MSNWGQVIAVLGAGGLVGAFVSLYRARITVHAEKDTLISTAAQAAVTMMETALIQTQRELQNLKKEFSEAKSAWDLERRQLRREIDEMRRTELTLRREVDALRIQVEGR